MCYNGGPWSPYYQGLYTCKPVQCSTLQPSHIGKVSFIILYSMLPLLQQSTISIIMSYSPFIITTSSFFWSFIINEISCEMGFYDFLCNITIYSESYIYLMGLIFCKFFVNVRKLFKLIPGLPHLSPVYCSIAECWTLWGDNPTLMPGCWLPAERTALAGVT